ncbi:hypothetical protein TIFTF001_029232 [Ficus carica]|uniref:Uncharacterized protein n=1 Tax=Ficus carica TaxID=3494 RepID=A0AA88DRF7_FICCA|nr:hypothetical protein TIFTF001_029232 [Ficus carica]
MRHLLSDVDLETLNTGRIPNHLDDLLWDGLNSNLRSLGLMYRTTDMVLKQRNHIKELEEKDNERAEKLLVIEQNFANVKASADGLIGELETVTQSSKEMIDMMKVTATLKARYDLLKEYKQGLLVNAEVDDEIELYEDTLDEAGCSSSAPADITVPASNDQGPSGVEPPVNVDL